MALDSLGIAVERAGDGGAGASELIGLGIAVRLLTGMLDGAQIEEDCEMGVDDEPSPF
jgi:hypothetical protein